MDRSELWSYDDDDRTVPDEDNPRLGTFKSSNSGSHAAMRSVRSACWAMPVDGSSSPRGRNPTSTRSKEGEVYHLGNIVTDEYEGQFSVKLNRTTTIEHTDDDIEVGDNTTEIEGALVDMQSGSGLIKRCPDDDCTRVLQNGWCSEHGKVEGEFDLRVKGVIDDGREVHETTFNQDDRGACGDLAR